MEGCNLGDEGVEEILQAIALAQGDIKLKTIDFSRNGIGSRGAKAIAEYLDSQVLSSQLTCLILHWNKLGPLGGEKLAEVLRFAQSLEILDLSFCSLGQKRKDREEML